MGISYMELLVILGVGSLMLGEKQQHCRAVSLLRRFISTLFQLVVSLHAGPKDLPKLGRYAGLATGRAAAYATAARNRFTNFAQEAQITKVASKQTLGCMAGSPEGLMMSSSVACSCTRRCSRACSSSRPSRPSSVATSTS